MKKVGHSSLVIEARRGVLGFDAPSQEQVTQEG
jgi:hypothetical protein